jgi:hypothetical protein
MLLRFCTNNFNRKTYCTFWVKLLLQEYNAYHESLSIKTRDNLNLTHIGDYLMNLKMRFANAKYQTENKNNIRIICILSVRVLIIGKNQLHNLKKCVVLHRRSVWSFNICKKCTFYVLRHSRDLYLIY